MTKAKSVLTTCPYCGVGCGVKVSSDKEGAITVAGDTSHPSNFGRLCSKGSALADTIGLEDRLLYPQVNGEQASWDKALDAVATGLQSVIDEYGVGAVAFYVSGQLLTEDYYVANKLMKGFIGSANIDTNSRLCMSSAVAGYKRAFGSDSVPSCYEDLEQADLIVLEGSNAAWCHPIVFQRIVKAKELNPQLKIVVIDPRKTATTDIADCHLAIKPGADAVLFNGLLQHLKQTNAINNSFVDEHTEGLTEALLAAEKLSASIQSVAQACELSEPEVKTFFDLFSTTEKVVTLYSQGVNQSSSGTDKSNSIINCHLATGRIGKAGMGPFSLTGQPNAMGGREVGALSNQLTAHMELDNPVHHELVSRFWKTDSLASTAGLKALDMFEAVASGEIKAIWVMATNPVVTLPNADKVREAIEACELVIVSECELKTGTVARADILLPALAWGERSGTVTNSERRISHQRSFLKHPGEAQADWWIISQVAQRLGFGAGFDFNSSADVFREYAALSGFENHGQRDFDISAFADISDQEYKDFEPVQWPYTKDRPKGTKRLFTDNHFYTSTGKAQIIAIEPREPKHPLSKEYPFRLNTGRVRDQWHTMTRTSRSARLNGHVPEPMVQIHPDDLISTGLEDGALARLDSRWGDMLARVEVSDNQRPGSLFVPMHWNDFMASKGRVNALVNPVVCPISGQPESKHTPVKISAYRPAWYGFMLSREPLDINDSSYWVKIKGEHFWRYEIAGEERLADTLSWAKDQLGVEGEWLEFSDPAAGRFRLAKIKEGRLESVAFIGPDHQLAARSWLSQLFSEALIDDAMRSSLLAGKAGAGIPDIGDIVCACFGVGENTIKDFVAKGKGLRVEDIGEGLKAGTNCGSCIPELKKYL